MPDVPFTDPDLTGRTAVITGGGTGLGRAFTLALAQRGATVWITGRRREPLQETAALHPAVRTFEGDVAEPGSMAALAAALDGPVHILVNNAAILGPVADLAGTARAAFDQVMRINVSGVFAATQALLPSLLAAAPGANVVNLSSGVGRTGRAGWGAYAASKFAVEGLTQVWADELRGRGVAVNALNPGATRTSMRAAAKPDEDPSVLPTPEDVVPSLLWLLSPEAWAMGLSGVSIDARDYMDR